MQKNYRVLVVDDNSQRRNDLKVIMEFLGEAAIVASSDAWLTQVSEPDELLGVPFAFQRMPEQVRRLRG